MRIDLTGYGARYRAFLLAAIGQLFSSYLLPGSPAYRTMTALRRNVPMAS
jgi:hypothetical protein